MCRASFRIGMTIETSGVSVASRATKAMITLPAPSSLHAPFDDRFQLAAAAFQRKLARDPRPRPCAPFAPQFKPASNLFAKRRRFGRIYIQSCFADHFGQRAR